MATRGVRSIRALHTVCAALRQRLPLLQWPPSPTPDLLVNTSKAFSQPLLGAGTVLVLIEAGEIQHQVHNIQHCKIQQ